MGLFMGAFCMLIALASVLLRPAVLDRLRMNVWILCAYYLIGGLLFGALAGLLSTRLRGRRGRTLNVMIVSVLIMVALLPNWSGPPWAWGVPEFLAIAMAAALGPFIGRAFITAGS
jgi:hypothetical protein